MSSGGSSGKTQVRVRKRYAKFIWEEHSFITTPIIITVITMIEEHNEENLPWHWGHKVKLSHVSLVSYWLQNFLSVFRIRLVYLFVSENIFNLNTLPVTQRRNVATQARNTEGTHTSQRLTFRAAGKDTVHGNSLVLFFWNKMKRTHTKWTHTLLPQVPRQNTEITFVKLLPALGKIYTLHRA